MFTPAYSSVNHTVWCVPVGVQFVKVIKTVLCNTKDPKRKYVFCGYWIKMLVLDFVTCSILLVEFSGLLKLVHGQLKAATPFLDQSPELVRNTLVLLLKAWVGKILETSKNKLNLEISNWKNPTVCLQAASSATPPKHMNVRRLTKQTLTAQ